MAGLVNKADKKPSEAFNYSDASDEQLLEYVGDAQFHCSVFWATAVAILPNNSCMLRSMVVYL